MYVGYVMNQATRSQADRLTGRSDGRGPAGRVRTGAWVRTDA